MAIFKCKMCGGALEIEQNATVVTCDYCGTKQTLPKLTDEKRANMYDRANHFRRNNDFDKAMGIYEQILNEDPTDAEAYWSLVLCQYGIEYVEDPKSHKRIPTINRAQFTSIFDDDNYKSALKHADTYQRMLYEAEAKTINEIQKGILAISQNEEPFDIFICYKETDKNGKRTQDSVLANDLYHQLTQEGFKVFFSRITLEDKLGTAYEPYIFAALNSAKVMVVLGTKPEYFNAVWVRNEWSRFLALVKNSKGQKVLIPAYKDMDPYDLPEEFSHLQAQDMSKLGFMQDLIRGIKKLVVRDTPAPVTVKEPVVVSTVSGEVAPLLKRGFIYLEDKQWDKADEYFERVLDMDPECANAYLGKLLAELHVSKQYDLRNYSILFDYSYNYSKVIRYGDQKLVDELKGYINQINERIERTRALARLLSVLKRQLEMETIYSNSVQMMENASTHRGYLNVRKSFLKIASYKDSASLAEQCAQLATECRKSSIYKDAVRYQSYDSMDWLKCAKDKFYSIRGYKDSTYRIEQCLARIKELEEQEKLRKQETEQQKAAQLRQLEGQERLRKQEAEKRREQAAKRAARNARRERRKEAFKKNIIKIVSVLLIISILVGIGIGISNFLKDGGLTFSRNSDGSYSVTGMMNSNVSSIVIPEEHAGKPVTEIDARAFDNCTNLQSVIIPNTVTVIYGRAFEGCSSLTSIVIPASVTKIYKDAFKGCTSLTSVTFEDPQGWSRITNWGTGSGTSLILTDPSENATYLTDTYADYIWIKPAN